jgi:lia operon protein LiaG
MIARSLLLLSAASFFTVPAVSQSSRHALKGDSIAVYNLVGELRVEPGTGSDVVVEVQRGGRDAAKLDIQTGPLRGRETLRIMYPDDVIVLPDWGRGWNTTLRVRDDGTFGEDSDVNYERRRGSSRDGHEVRITGRARDGLEAYADLKVSLPAGKTIRLNLGVGKAFVSNVDGDIRVSVASADVAADRTRGKLRISTGSGNVDLRTATGEVALETGSGDVTVAGMQGTSLRLETGSGNVTLADGKASTLQVETGSGDIEASGAAGDDVSFETGSGNVDVGLVSGFTSLSIETGSGDVTVRVPPTIGAQVDLDTGSGDIDLGGLTLSVRRIEHDHVSGTIGDGKGRLSVETGSGNVRLQKL